MLLHKPICSAISAMMVADSATCHFKFQAIPEIFENLSDAARQKPGFQTTTLPGLGLKERLYDFDHSIEFDKLQIEHQKPWARFKSYVHHLNAQASGLASYKVLYLTRHGLGYHNAYMAKVGRDAWNNHWSHLDGDGEVTWADSLLNRDGIEQVKTLGRFWSDAVANDKIPIPETIYTSPLARCLETTRLVFENVMEEHGAEFRPVVKELLRERLTDHTCDRRHSKSWIQEHYPGCSIERGFSEEDVLWTGSRWESTEEHVARKQQLLEDIFETDRNAFVALTTHSYAISAIQRAVGLTEFRLREGSSVALLVKAEKVGATV